MDRSRQRDIAVVAHLILGLPGESLQDMLDTARKVAHAHVQGVKLHPLYVIRGTALEEMYSEGLYHPLTEKEAVRATLSVLEELPEDTVIHRLTSDPHPEELVAPTWMLDRKGVRERLVSAMEHADFRQGSRRNKRRSE
jgi:radical SAM superfamily enzyme